MPELKDYTVVTPITFQDTPYSEGQTISLSDEDAVSFLESASIIQVAEKGESGPTGPDNTDFGAGQGVTGPAEQETVEPTPDAPVEPQPSTEDNQSTPAQDTEAEIDPLTGSPVGAVDTSSLTPEVLDTEGVL